MAKIFRWGRIICILFMIASRESISGTVSTERRESIIKKFNENNLPSTAEELIHIGNDFNDIGKVREANRCYNRAYNKAYGSDSVAYTGRQEIQALGGRAITFASLNRYDQARKDLDAIIALDPSNKFAKNIKLTISRKLQPSLTELIQMEIKNSFGGEVQCFEKKESQNLSLTIISSALSGKNVGEYLKIILGNIADDINGGNADFFKNDLIVRIENNLGWKSILTKPLDYATRYYEGNILIGDVIISDDFKYTK